MVDCEGNKLHDCDVVEVHAGDDVVVNVVLKGKTWHFDGARTKLTEGFIKQYKVKKISLLESTIAVRKKKLRFCRKCPESIRCNQSNTHYEVGTHCSTANVVVNVDTVFISRHCPFYVEYYLQNLRNEK